MGHNDERPLAAKIVDKKLEERVDGKGFVNIAYRIDPLRKGEGNKTNPGGYRVEWHPEPIFSTFSSIFAWLSGLT